MQEVVLCLQLEPPSVPLHATRRPPANNYCRFAKSQGLSACPDRPSTKKDRGRKISAAGEA